MNKKYWFGHSLVWIGVLSNSPEAIAETISPPIPDPVVPVAQPSVAEPSAPEIVKPIVTAISAPEPVSAIERSWMTPAKRDLAPAKAPVDCRDCVPAEIDRAESDAIAQSQADDSAIEPELNGVDVPDDLTRSDEAAQSGEETGSTDDRDPELGRLRLRENRVVAEPDEDVVFLQGRIDSFRSDNILLDDFDPTTDQFTRVGASLLAAPQLGENTQLFASIGGNFAFYGDQSNLNYHNLELRADLQQTIFPNTYATIGWSNRQFFSSEDGDRFLNDHALRFALSRRDSIAERLTLDSYYQIRFNFSDPIDRSRLTNSLGASLNYALEPNLGLGLNYQLDWVDFTQQDRNDTYHQVTAQLSYDLTRNSRLSLYGGFSFGDSSNSAIDFDSSIVGVSFSTYLPLF